MLLADGVLPEVGHTVFMVATWLFSALTIGVVALSLYRLLPKRPRSAVPPRRDQGRRR
ncbi:hypothetical protein GCM10009836_65080 [Pseudonocardia ailaonensis]|uniref:Heme exporter protein D n=1 Tax=Pseudonocardia ailaonensis TaxID=367279 RepID=A0ABN2NP41_9PSEU